MMNLKQKLKETNDLKIETNDELKIEIKGN